MTTPIGLPDMTCRRSASTVSSVPARTWDGSAAAASGPNQRSTAFVAVSVDTPPTTTTRALAGTK